jgi:hypothetical protein
MARIRTIKPEFPQSESIGRLSRDARLLFILLWTVADDEGRCRAASRMLASLLYPYDDDAGQLISGWLAELEQHGKVRRYEVDGSAYLEIQKWKEHQKIDKPSASKLPPFREASPNIREASGWEGKGREGKGPGVDPTALEPEPPDPFDEAEAALRAIPGITDHPVGVTPGIGPIWQLIQQGYDLKRQIIPSIRDQLAKRPKGRLIKAWNYFVPGIIDSVQGAVPAPAAAVPVETWSKRLAAARAQRQWDPKWGPKPSENGCQVPADLLTPDDGHGWTEWKAA